MPGLLRLGTGDEIHDPSAEDVERALRSLHGTDGHVILERDSSHFMQVASGTDRYGRDEGFLVLEYNEGTPQLHFQCTEDLEPDRIVRAFLTFHAGGSDYKHESRWKPLNRPLIRGFDRVIKVATLAIIAAILWFVWRMAFR